MAIRSEENGISALRGGFYNKQKVFGLLRVPPERFISSEKVGKTKNRQR